MRFFIPKGVKTPVVASAVPDELFRSPRSWAEQAYPNLIHYNSEDPANLGLLDLAPPRRLAARDRHAAEDRATATT